MSNFVFTTLHNIGPSDGPPSRSNESSISPVQLSFFVPVYLVRLGREPGHHLIFSWATTWAVSSSRLPLSLPHKPSSYSVGGIKKGAHSLCPRVEK
ncbi:unnamed protein product [Linum trigynum]|uniref:Uncharacterized protein n=1 Tax=Linum trigynum TaxID=586398 RepID=A0AAV2CNH2_9ROSI